MSVRVAGSYNRSDFVYTSDLDEEMEFGLAPALVASESAATGNHW